MANSIDETIDLKNYENIDYYSDVEYLVKSFKIAQNEGKLLPIEETPKVTPEYLDKFAKILQEFKGSEPPKKSKMAVCR